MRQLAALAAVAFLAAPAHAQEVKPASKEYSEAFCLGWNSAVLAERSRFQRWRDQVMAGRTADDRSGIPGLVNGLADYVLLLPLMSKQPLDSKIEVDCTPPQK